MKLAEKNVIFKECAFMNDSDLEDLYYSCLNDSLGSDVERMIELDYDIRDINERRRHEKYLVEKCSLVESICFSRGIELFKSNE